LKTQHLAVFRAKNEPKTNPFLSTKSAHQSEKTRQDSRVRIQEKNEEVKGVGGLSMAEVSSVKAELPTKKSLC
jgi:hypothetical protein